MIDHNSHFADDETERKKKKKAKTMGKEAVLTSASRPNFSFENVDRVKQISSTDQPDGSYASKENTSGETKVVEILYIVFSFKSCV